MSEVSETIEMMETREAGGLARAIAVAGLQVSQAADELQIAAERLLNAEALARDVELRAQTAEEQLAQGATKNAELLEMVAAAQQQQTEAEERTRRAEQRLDATMERSRRLEEQLAAAEDRIAELGARPVTPSSAPHDRSELAHALAAEVRRPLTTILGTTLSLRHADLGATECREMVRDLSASARKLDRLIAELLEVDRIASGAYEPKLRRTDLEAMMRRVVEDSPDLEGRDVHLQIEHVALEVDPTLVEQIVESLLANAARRTAPGNPVWVRLAPDAGGAVIAVEDACTDLPAGLREALLAAVSEDRIERRAEPLRGPSGLPLPARLAEIHGGRSWAEERPGGGASFRVFLPGPTDPDVARLASDIRSMETVVRATEGTKPATEDRAETRTLSLVEDDREVSFGAASDSFRDGWLAPGA
jgi:K+-sensing histidine kinase KdpD